MWLCPQVELSSGQQKGAATYDSSIIYRSGMGKVYFGCAVQRGVLYLWHPSRCRLGHTSQLHLLSTLTFQPGYQVVLHPRSLAKEL